MNGPSSWPALLGTEVDWSFTTTPQAGLGGMKLPCPAGKVLGGSSSINGMFHLRGHRANYDAWAASGAHGWSYAELLPYFMRSEQTAGRDPNATGFRHLDIVVRLDGLMTAGSFPFVLVRQVRWPW